ncbi:sugar-binding protein [Ferruginibacter albus]|uniref:sugar-binding protein n=1 Tax=Ferruginibacter albus TaxID=2875540 RepID=UPI001CC71D2F|nr:sugar-binding protein [Ferruginibacter albus]UAY51218.1 T9SS type A sorting domain-containing protein [Ferruginibacter albus]
MKKTLQPLVIFLFCLINVIAYSQPVAVTKSNPLKVYMHYMPWFDAPENPVAGTNYSWGYHWKMNTRNPNLIDTNGEREIASHYYPLIGPYSSKDPAVVEYHLLLMKLSGVDGVLLDWYGQTGSNSDVGSLLINSDSLINKTQSAGIDFGIVAEDRFWRNIQDGQNAFTYAKNNYFNQPNYIKIGTNNEPLVGVFGPITFHNANSWTQILGAAGQPVQFLPGSFNNDNLGTNVNGKFDWVYSNSFSGLLNFYNNNAPTLNTAIGAAFPRFYDYYKEGGAGNTLFFIADNNGQTLDSTLSLANKYSSRIDALQLVTFNDFGEGTILEPTVEFGFRDLAKVQRFTGVPYTENDLQQVYRLFTLRKKYLNYADKQSQLDQVYTYFTSLKIDSAVALMDAIDNAPTVSLKATGTPSEDGATGSFVISGTNIKTAVTVTYTVGGTAPEAHYNALPLLAGTVTLDPANTTDTILINAVDDTLINPKETISLTLNTDTAYFIQNATATLTIKDNEVPFCSEAMVVNTSTGPVIDGAADLIWSKVTPNYISQIISGQIQTGSTWQAMYDAANFYLLVKVKDTNRSTIGASIWDQDGVEVFLAGNNSKAGAYTANDHQYRFNWNIKPFTTDNITGSTNNKAGITYAIVTTADGYTLEASFPWTTIGGTAPFNGKQIGFDIDINDQHDNKGQRESTAGWYGTNSDDYQNTAGFGTAELTVCNALIDSVKPEIIITDTAKGKQYNPFSGYQVIANNSAATFNAINLPAGLSINTNTGFITGTPADSGYYSSIIIAANAIGADSTLLIFKIDSTQLPVIATSIYPNPVFNNIIYIPFIKNSSPSYTIRLISSTGQLIYHTVIVPAMGDSNYQLHIPSLPTSGFYLLELFDDKNTRKVYKVIIQ